MTGCTPATRILLVEDDEDVRETTRALLERAGFALRTAEDGVVGLAAALSWAPALAVVDVAMPGRDGLELTRHLRAGDLCPVILLTARDLPEDEVAGLGAGADDYVTKPFDAAVLVARITAVLRRTAGAERGTGEAVLVLDHHRLVGTWRDTTVRLTPTEYALLDHLLQNRRQVVGRDQLLRLVWGACGDGHVVDVNVARIRRKLGRDVIETEYGLGYRLGGPG